METTIEKLTSIYKLYSDLCLFGKVFIPQFKITLQFHSWIYIRWFTQGKPFWHYWSPIHSIFADLTISFPEVFFLLFFSDEFFIPVFFLLILLFHQKKLRKRKNNRFKFLNVNNIFDLANGDEKSTTIPKNFPHEIYVKPTQAEIV